MALILFEGAVCGSQNTRRGGVRREVNLREVLNAIFYVLSTGSKRQALPKDLPPKSMSHSYFVLWEWEGTPKRVDHALYVATRSMAHYRTAPYLPPTIIIRNSVASDRCSQI